MNSGTPSPSTRIWRLLPSFPPIRWVRTDSVLGKRCLDHCSMHTRSLPCDVLHIIILHQSSTPEGKEEPCLEPFPEVLVNRTRASEPFLGQRLPSAPRSRDKDYVFEYTSAEHRFPPTSRFPAEYLVGFAFHNWDKGLNTTPELVRNFPRSELRHTHPCCGSSVSRCIYLNQVNDG